MEEEVKCTKCEKILGTIKKDDKLERIFTITNNGAQCQKLPIIKHFTHCKDCCTEK